MFPMIHHKLLYFIRILHFLVDADTPAYAQHRAALAASPAATQSAVAELLLDHALPHLAAALEAWAAAADAGMRLVPLLGQLDGSWQQRHPNTSQALRLAHQWASGHQPVSRQACKGGGPGVGALC